MLMRIRRSSATLLVLLAALLLTGCLKLDMDMTVSEDNTISGTLIFAFDKALLQAAGQDPKDAVQGAVSLPSDLKGVTQKDYEDDKFQGVQYTIEGLSLDEWNKEGTDLKIERTGDEFKVSGTMDLSSASSSTGDPTVDAQLESAFKTAEIRIKLTFPGEVKDGNGTIEGNSITWEPKFGESTELSATASAVAGGGMMMWLLIGGIILLIVIVVLIVVLSRKGKGGPEAPVATEAVAEGEMAPEATEAQAPPTAPMPTPEAPPAPEAPPTPEAPPAPEAPGGDAPPPA